LTRARAQVGIPKTPLHNKQSKVRRGRRRAAAASAPPPPARRALAAPPLSD